MAGRASTVRSYRAMWFHIWGMTTGMISHRLGITQPAVVYILQNVVGKDIYVGRGRSRVRNESWSGKTDNQKQKEFIKIEMKLHPELVVDGVKIIHKHIGSWIIFEPEFMGPDDWRDIKLRFSRMEVMSCDGDFYERHINYFSAMVMRWKDKFIANEDEKMEDTRKRLRYRTGIRPKFKKKRKEKK